MTKGRVTQSRLADENNAVLTVEGGEHLYRREPCAECPWRVENAGKFPAEAFRLSANTAHDAAMHTFACHMAGTTKPTTCAGFLLKNAANNLSVRIGIAMGRIDFDQISDGGCDLFESYRAMAIANGVPKDDPALAECRDNEEPGWTSPRKRPRNGSRRT